MRISIDEIVAGMIVDEDIYSDQGNMIVGRGFSISNVIIFKNLMKKQGIDKVKILYLQEPKAVKADEPKTKESPIDKVIEKEIDDFKKEFESAVNKIQDQIFSESSDTQTLRAILDETLNLKKGRHINVFQLMQKVKSQENETFAHCYSVSLSAYAIGKWIGLDDETLTDLTISAILSDIGKASVPQSIIMKKGKLSEEEYTQTKKHVFHSLDMLSSYELEDTIKDGILYHHERIDGSGYPNGLKGDEIPLFSKIIAIADVFVALTSARPYREKLTPFDAIIIMEREFMDKLDIRILTEFFKRVGNSYIGNPVRLTDEREGEIIFMTSKTLSKPVIKLFDTDDVIDLSAAQYKALSIKEFI